MILCVPQLFLACFYDNVAHWEKFACVLFRICCQVAIVVGSQNILIGTAECECLIN